MALNSNRGHNAKKGKQGFQPVKITPLNAPTVSDSNVINNKFEPAGKEDSSYDDAMAKFLNKKKPTPASLIEEAEKRKGKKLTDSEKKVAEKLGEWYQNGSLKVHTSLNGKSGECNINFADAASFDRGGKAVGFVQIGSEGFGYFYEVDGDEVSFRQADGFYHLIDKKLPLNYALRRKMNGTDISENNTKWVAQSLINRFGG